MKSKWNIAIGGFAVLLCAALIVWTTGRKEWSDDFDASLKKAAAENKVMLVNFTGSDWCGWCIKLEKEVFSHNEFKKGVKDDFVLVEVDFPKDKNKISPGTLKRNRELEAEYMVEGFPTILLLDGEGRPFAITDYLEGGPKKYVAHLNELAAVKGMRNEAFAKADMLEGVEKAKVLVAALDSLGLDEPLLGKFYGKQMEAIKEADPNDETGFMKAMALKQKFIKFEDDFNELAEDGQFQEAIALTTQTISSGGFEGEMLQQLVFIEATMHAQIGELAKALESLNKADAIVPGSPLAPQIAALKEKVVKKLEHFNTKAAEPKNGEEKPEEPAKPAGTE